MVVISLDELATLVRLFGRRVRIGKDGVVSINRPAPAVWDGRADPECSGVLTSESGSTATQIPEEDPSQCIGGSANLLAIEPATDLVATDRGIWGHLGP